MGGLILTTDMLAVAGVRPATTKPSGGDASGSCYRAWLGARLGSTESWRSCASNGQAGAAGGHYSDDGDGNCGGRSYGFKWGEATEDGRAG